MLPEDMTNRPGDIRFKLYAIERMMLQIERIRKSMRKADINGKLPEDY